MVRTSTILLPYECCGVRIDALGIQEVTDSLILAAERGEQRCVHLCNAYTLALAVRSNQFRQLLNGSDMNLPDGAPVAWFGASLGRHQRLLRPLPGPSLMTSLFDKSQGTEVRHFLLGASEDVLLQLRRNLQSRFPAARIVGSFSPPFTSDVDDLVVTSMFPIQQSRANMVWVGLGTPKQDWVAHRIAEATGVVAVPVGAAFDFISGRKAEAPRWVRGSGLEWLFRLATEPRRLWRRYLIDGLVFVGAAPPSWFRQRAAMRRRESR